MARLAILIHGMWATSDVWRNWRKFLEDRGWQTLAPSLRHHDVPPAAPPPALGETGLCDYVADLEAIIAGLPEKPVVIGHSMGGLIALRLCANGVAKAGVLLTLGVPASDSVRGLNLLALLKQNMQIDWQYVAPKQQ